MVVHEFSNFNTHIYRRWQAARTESKTQTIESREEGLVFSVAYRIISWVRVLVSLNCVVHARKPATYMRILMYSIVSLVVVGATTHFYMYTGVAALIKGKCMKL